jgi:hypothetical protein
MAAAHPLDPPATARDLDVRAARRRADLDAATARLRAMGLDEEAAFVGPIDEAIAWLDEDLSSEPCASRS